MANVKPNGKRSAARTEILLESGTNELEIMEFTIAGDSFGINVAKVTEIMQYEGVKPMPNSQSSIEGVFMPRDVILTVVDLAHYMGLPPSEDNTRDMLIVTSFNKMNAAFHVHTVETIHRINWNQIEKPDTTIYGGEEGLATGIAKIGSKLITIVDFEKIVFDISPQTGIQMSEISDLGPRARSTKPVVMAEDSDLLKKMVVEALTQAGYANIKAFTNGQDAWEHLQAMRDEVMATGDAIGSRVAAIITDIEMPKMDGHRLTKLTRDDRILKDIPVIIFSSLIDEAMQVKGEQLGATAQLSKPEIGNLVGTLDKHIL
ncbi:MAG: chemotaxis protein [Oscillospiraceae bacterium]|jgi:two-component system chemotaxis response regulator CheV|nr:chemotaxis protein [Oscillospiraceae bacterium]